MLEKAAKERIIKKFATHAGDTGSPQVQIAVLTEEIKQLAEHLKKHKKDFSSRRGLLKKVIQRRRLLRYLEREDITAFENLVAKLKIRIARRMPEAAEEPVETAAAAEIGEEAPEVVKEETHE